MCKKDIISTLFTQLAPLNTLKAESQHFTWKLLLSLI